MLVLYICLTIGMGVLARMAGGGLYAEKLPKSLTWVPEALFAIPSCLHLVSLGVPWWVAALSVLWSYIWMQTGHGVALPWGSEGFFKAKDPVQQKIFSEIRESLPKRRQTLSPIVDFIVERSGLTMYTETGLHSAAYCRVFFAVKGFLIGLPLGGVPLTVFWPLSYEIGSKAGTHAVSEALSGVFAGLLISASIHLTGGLL